MVYPSSQTTLVFVGSVKGTEDLISIETQSECESDTDLLRTERDAFIGPMGAFG